MDNDYILRRELDLQTNLLEMIVQLKNNHQFHKVDISKKKEMYDEFYSLVKKNYLSEDIPNEEKRNIEESAMEHILNHTRQETRKTMH